MDEQRQPEILNADLAPMVLNLAAFGETDLLSLPWLTLPPKGNLYKAVHDLSLLGALSEEGMITSVGRKMVTFPCHPRLAKMMLHAYLWEPNWYVILLPYLRKKIPWVT